MNSTMKTTMKSAVLALAATLTLSNNSQAQDGSLDLSFGNNGTVTTSIGSSFTFAKTMATQADGKILVAGYLTDGINGTIHDFALVRYNNDGSLDLTFDTDGIVTTDIGTNNQANTMGIQSDGKILVAGSFHNGTDYDFVLVRYNIDGSLDLTFDTDGIVTTDIGATHNKADAMVIQPDGKIILAGNAGNSSVSGNYDFALVRYNSDGSLDLTFDSDGIVTTTIGNSSALAKAIDLQPDGKILVAGHTFNAGFALARYNSDGSLDLTFDSDGVVTTSIGSSSVANTIKLQSDGKILLAGHSTNGTSSEFALVRYNNDGSLDFTFDTDGIVTTPIGSTEDVANSISLQPDGKILVAGASAIAGISDFALARYNSDGSLDLTFDSDGIVTTPIGSFSAIANAMTLQPDGKILIAGYTHNNGIGIDFALARYNNTITSINTIQDYTSNMAVYPNPFSALTTIEFGTAVHEAELSIYNMFGQKIKTISNISDTMISLSRDKLASGFYVICLTQNNQIIATNKIVIVD